MIPTIVDCEGNVLKVGDLFIYEEMEFVADYIEKEARWIGHPCGVNPSNEDLNLLEIDPDDIKPMNE